MRASNVTVRRRLFAALIVGTILFLALVVRLAYVQIWVGPELSDKAEDSWRRDIKVTAKRGEILDRNGVQLAYNISSPTVVAVPAQIKDPKTTAAKIAAVLQISEETVYKQITVRKSSVYIRPGGRKITIEKADEIRDLQLPGIWVTEDNKRHYPFGGLAAHVLGFTGDYNQGLTGIELKYDKTLTGIDGSISYLSDAAGHLMPGSTDEYKEPLAGLNLQLTIDSHIQSIMERELDQTMVKYQPKHVVAIAMDPNNGEILAMGSRPGFEPGNYKGYPVENYNRNLPIWMTYEPGSTFKIITLAAALEEKKISLTEGFHDPGAIEVAGARLRCWKRGGHGSETFLQVVENSCNPGFVVMGQRLGKEKLFDYIHNFGFGKKTGIDLGGEENGIMFKLSRVGPVELATTSFGQGVSVTPIQQITAVSAAINGGKLFKPHVAKGWYKPETGELVDSMKPEVVRQVISPETSKQVRETLESVVANGTGRNAFVDGYRVGGKTGTAQKVINGRYSSDEHIVSFIGFAPADDPKVVIYAAVDDPQGIQFGGLIAAPLVKNIMEDTLRYMKIPPRKDQMERKYVYGDTKIVEVPNLVGMSITDIYEQLNMNFQLAKSGVGRTVINQVPKPGTRIEQGSTIRIYLSDAQSAPDGGAKPQMQ
ncbi:MULTISPECIES: stage V sporulation protein D [unclassified Paenibacillus]|uniref:stage V sporulation protein D n=1 Tax=unclassified Paenibacillus TaxID=185978 RepID=UPI001AE20B62|nr:MULTISPECIES: stage V sporulation protein D [unclassified Paenibacillus]MBP1156282.1 stage V sporulation protein D (sporulation-specific penicillin-binding protein) [Paenibacillus sp. PvP091]MBP1168332.1 stage V sporulation protein D (sporulation-specific penicillin-binding protein) [Paenibacillus sp. PvR098]MBP2439360.1 stage V sporulation protein D (sporulation-specific penicillin-binding protein) [Paenibacillus sp. PvP052]